MDSRNAFVAQDTITLEWIERTFDGAFMPTVDRMENILWIKGKRLTLEARLALDRSAICLVLSAPLVQGVDILHASIAANNCNLRFGWARFWIHHTSDPKICYLQVDFTLLFERGFVPYHLIRAFELLEIIAVKGIEAEFMSMVTS